MSSSQVEEGREALRNANELVSADGYDSSIVLYRRASELFSATNQRDLYFYSLVQISDVFIRQTRFAEAESLLHILEASVPRELGEKHRVTAGVYRLMGYLRTCQDRFDEALRYTKRGFEIWSEVAPEERVALAGYQYGLGIVYLRKGDGASALEWLRQAEENQERFGSPSSSGVVQTLLSIGQAHDLLGDLAGSIQVFERTLNLLDSLHMEQSPVAVVGRHLLAVALRQTGRFEESLTAEREALRISRAVYGSHHLATASALAQMGDHCVLAGDYASAPPYYGEALEIFGEFLPPDHSSISEINRKLARLSLALGNADAAMQLYRSVIAAHESSFGPRHPSLAGLYSEAAEAFLAGGEWEEALSLCARAQNLVPTDDAATRSEIGLRRGRALSMLGRLDEAALCLHEALALLDSFGTGNPEIRSGICHALGELLERTHNPSAAVEMYDRSIDALSAGSTEVVIGAEQYTIPPVELRRPFVNSMYAKARILADLGLSRGGEAERSVAALDAYAHAGAVLALSRDSYRSEGSKLAAQKELQEVCGGGLAVAFRLFLKTGDPQYRERAFSFAEQARANVLLEGIERAQSTRSAPSPDDPVAKGNALRIKAERIQRQIEWTDRYGDQQHMAELRSELLMTYQAIEALDDTLSLPGGKKLDGLAGNVSIAALQSVLEPGACLVEYAQGEGNLYAFVVAKGDVTLLRLGNATAVDSLALEMRRGLRGLDRSRFLGSARALYARLIGPVERDLKGVSHLIVVPKGGLNYVPFEALLVPGKDGRQRPRKDADPRVWRYLILDYDISYALSGTLYYSTKTARGAPDTTSTSFTGFAPVFRSQNAKGNEWQKDFLTKLDPLATRSISVDGRTFNELPYSLSEVRGIAGLFATAGDKSLCMAESVATEENFKENAGTTTILHVATHGFINEDKPSLSALLFSPTGGTTSREDGVLYAGEVYDLRLKADLVVLSSCESGVGRLAPGEGLMAMSRGFIYAGARNIAYSLWKVNDRKTGELMERFYRHLLRGKSYAAALASAKREMITHPTSANPYFWAGFVLTGQ
ncbi:MAG: CHAT domain-containing protein [Bacteroidota bacterium]